MQLPFEGGKRGGEGGKPGTQGGKRPFPLPSPSHQRRLLPLARFVTFCAAI